MLPNGRTPPKLNFVRIDIKYPRISDFKTFIERTLSCDSHVDENPFGTGPHEIHAPLAFKLHGRKSFPAFFDEGGRETCDFIPYFGFGFRIGSQFFRMVLKQVLYLVACLILVVERPKDLLLIGVPEDTHFGVQLQSAIDFRPFAVCINKLTEHEPARNGFAADFGLIPG